MSRPHHLWILTLVLSACFPPRSPELIPEPLASPAARAAGCWMLETVGWAAPQLPGATRVLFDTVPEHPQLGNRILALRPLFAGADTSRMVRIASWGVRRDDSRIWAVLGNGFGGLQFRLELRGDALSGSARRFTDTWPQLVRGGNVRGTRTSCDPPHPSSSG